MGELVSPYTPKWEIREGSTPFTRRLHFVENCLFNRYSALHGANRDAEAEEFRDGFSWKGPMKFAAPIDAVLQYLPNELVLDSIERALCAICPWPNARKQAFQLKQAVKYGEASGSYEGVAQIGNLIARIAEEKPYGEETVGTPLLQVGWYEIDNFGQENDMKDLFPEIVKELTAFANGEYKYCLADYPAGPFSYLRDPQMFEEMSSDIKASYIQYLLKTRYPILLEHPELAQEFNIQLP